MRYHRWTTLVRRLSLLALLGSAVVLSGCSPFYVIRAGWAQMGILRSRVPLTEVMTDPETDPTVRGKLRLAWDARSHAVNQLGFQNVGNAYTSLAPLQSDTLALVLSAAYRDRLAFRTWWFPIVGRVPYRAYFSIESAEAARDDLEGDGFDTYLRPTAAFSTLGWFDDPLYSTLLRRDDVELVSTVMHELAHNHLYVPSRGRFNESFATFAGHASAIHFFCGSQDGGPRAARPEGGSLVTVKCQRARDRWADALDISRFVDRLEVEILELYQRAAEASEEATIAQGSMNEGAPGDVPVSGVILVRDSIYRAAQDEFVNRVQPALRASTYGYLATQPLNNATFLARSLYQHRLPDFDRLWKAWEGDLGGLLAWLRSEAREVDDPFELLERTEPFAPG